LKIVQVIPELAAGGAERTTLDVSKAVVAAGGQSLIISHGGRLEAELQGPDERILHLPVHSKNPLVMRRNRKQIMRAAADFEADLIHARSRAPAWSARKAARKLGLPFVTTYHGTYNSNSLLKTRYNSIMAAGDLVIANSNFIAKHIQKTHGTDPARIRVIPRGIDLAALDPKQISNKRQQDMARFLGWDRSRFLIVMPGRLTRWKGQLLMLDALALLRERGIDAVLALPGDDQGRDIFTQEIRDKIVQLELGQQVQVPGHVGDMPALYALADLVVSASLEPEAFGRVAVEGQAAAKPVLASAHGGALETILDGQTGLLVEPGSAKAMADGMAQILALSPESRAAWGRAGQKWVGKTFSVETMCATTLQVYAAVLSARR
jgi:glycosyltransferase involved in cell wall biosynthesis